MKIVLSGGTGFIGKALSEKLLGKGHDLVILTRKDREPDRMRYVSWNAAGTGPWTEEIRDADAVINLAGESVAGGRWNRQRKQRIRDSRILSTRALVDAVSASSVKPSVLINASAVGYYGHVPEGDVPEEAPPGRCFLAETCVQWEKEALRAREAGVRVVIPRIGIVLGNGGGALERMRLPFLFFAGGPLGSGRQWFPWVHLEDIVEMIVFALEHPQAEGPFNTAAPGAVTMAGFCREFARALNRPAWAHVPAGVLKILAGEMAGLFLEGQKAVPAKLNAWGYRFLFPDLQKALEDLASKRRQAAAS